MRFFKEFNGFIFEFVNVKAYLLFMLGRLCGFLFFLLMIDAFMYCLYLDGYSDEFTSIFYIIYLIISLFI
jgi:hypothetical protein